jgi:hypothetical protein
VLLVLTLVGSSAVVAGGPAAAQADDPSGYGSDGSPADLQAHAGDSELRLTWLAPSAAVSGYDVQYKTRDAADREAASPGDPSTGWVDAGHSGTDPEHTISGLSNGRRYHLRVRAVGASGSSPWAITGGAPTAAPDPEKFCRPIPVCPRELVVVPPVLRLDGSNQFDLDEGRAVNVTVTFRPTPGSSAANEYAEVYPPEDVNVIRYSELPVDTVVNVEVDTSHRYHTATEGEDFTLSTKKLTIGAYDKFASLQVRAHADRKSEGTEWIVLKLTPVSNAPYKMREPIGVILKIWDFSRELQLYLLGPASVSEGAESLRVAVVLARAAPEGGATVELSVGDTSTATEGDDFTMPATVTVPEGKDWVKTALTIIDDDIHEGPETIDLKAVNTATNIKGSRRLTIRDDDPAPPLDQQQQVQTDPQPATDGTEDEAPEDEAPEDVEPEDVEPEAEAPGPVQNLQLASKRDGTRLRVDWDPPTSGAAVARYEVTLRDSEGDTVQVRRPGPKKNHVVFRKLQSGATYQVSVLANSGDAEGEAVTAHLTLD